MHSLGNLGLLKLHKIAFLCSRNCPEQVRKSAQHWADLQRENGVCVISGYHSPIEKEVLQRLLPGRQPIIIALASGLKSAPPEWGAPIEAGRLLVLTRYAESVSHADQSKCFQRNRLMLELADEVVIAHASPGGNLERLCREFDQKRFSWLYAALM